MLSQSDAVLASRAMSLVPTVTGEIDADQLGVTLMHEHVFILNADVQNQRDDWDEDVRRADALEKLNALKAKGVDTIVDPTVIGLGRFVPRLVELGAHTDLRIVVATGIYTYGDAPFWFHYRVPAFTGGTTDPMTDLFVKDLTEGIAGTHVRAAILKCATDEEGLTPGVERVLRAVAQASVATGAPITTHTHAASKRGLEQQRVFLEEGVDLARVVIGHSGDSSDLDYLMELMDAGSTIGMDRFGIDPILPFEARVATVAALCERGYADRMVLSHDAACFIDWFDPDLTEMRRTVMPNWHYTHIHDDVLPALRERGVTQAQLDQMLVGNPRRVLAGA